MNKKRLILANGAFKSGSTWLREILLNLQSFKPIPPTYASERYSHWVDICKLDRFQTDAHLEGDFLSKSHVYRANQVKSSLKLDSIITLNISRDVRDAVVSAFHHYRRDRRKPYLTFSKYYWSIGRFKALEIAQYNQSWPEDHPRVFFTTYEGLKNSFTNELFRIAEFIGVACTEETVEYIRTTTSLAALRQKKGEQATPEEGRFFRKGVIGDWKGHFGEDELSDLDMVLSGDMSVRDKIKYWAAFPARRNLTQSIASIKQKIRF